MIGGALYVRVTLQGLARPCNSLTFHLATFCTFADVATCRRFPNKVVAPVVAPRVTCRLLPQLSTSRDFV